MKTDKLRGFMKKIVLKGETALNLLSNFMIINNFYFALFCPQTDRKSHLWQPQISKFSGGSCPRTFLR